MADSSKNPKTVSMVASGKDTFIYEGIPLHSFVTPDDMKAIRSMEVREDDVILTTYPKCGTHWMLEIILLAGNSGIPLTSQERITRRQTALLELPIWHRKGAKSYYVLAGAPSPRLYVSHLPIQFLPEQIWEKKPKAYVLSVDFLTIQKLCVGMIEPLGAHALQLHITIVYVARKPRDCMASFYNFMLPDPQALTWQEAFDYFLSDNMPYGSIWEHQYGFWKHRNDDNFLYVNFEDMKKDPTGNVKRVAAHLDYNLSAEQIAEVVRLSSIAEMKATYAKMEEDLGQIGKYFTRAGGILPFLHKGTVGGWKNLFTVAQNEAFQQYQEMKMKGFDKDFKI